MTKLLSHLAQHRLTDRPLRLELLDKLSPGNNPQGSPLYDFPIFVACRIGLVNFKYLNQFDRRFTANPSHNRRIKPKRRDHVAMQIARAFPRPGGKEHVACGL